eukprot:9091213-Lingulodinium_polyedra.AAC.1
MCARGGLHTARASVAVVMLHARACAAEGLLGSCQNSGHPGVRWIYVPMFCNVGVSVLWP